MAQQVHEIEIPHKVICIGDVGSGKTSLITRFTTGVFGGDYRPTIGCDFFIKAIKLENGHNIRLRLWDLGGEERFDYMRNVFFKGSDGAIILFDVCNHASFENVSKWLDQIHEDQQDLPVILVGNKCDLADSREVTPDEAETFANELGINYFETSAKDGTGVDDCFKAISEKIMPSTE